jgi:hypothetical protein
MAVNNAVKWIFNDVLVIYFKSRRREKNREEKKRGRA